MTPKQSDFLRSLATEKDITSLSEAQQAYVARVLDGTADPTPAQASRVIDALLALPRKAAVEYPKVPAGRYALVHPASMITEFFIVDRPTEGQWAGRTFVKQQASDDKYPVRGARAAEVLARIEVDPQAAMIRYGHELGRCGNCGRTLTDEVSRAMGIGPDCAKALGMIRPSVEEVVAPAATPPAPAPKSTPKLGWREEKAAIKAQQGDVERASGPCSQNRDRPGCDIFGAPL